MTKATSPRRMLVFVIFAALLGTATTRDAAAQTFKPGDKVEYKSPHKPDAWEVGTVESITPSGKQAIVREEPNEFYPDGNTRAYAFDELRPVQPHQAPPAKPANAPGAPKKGDKVEYKVHGTNQWKVGTIDSLTPSGKQVIIREEPNEFYPTGNTTAVDLDEIRPVGGAQAEPPAKGPEPNPVGRTPDEPAPKNPPPGPPAAGPAGPLMTQDEILGILRRQMGDKPFDLPTEKREQIFQDLAKEVMRRGVNFRYQNLSDFSNQLGNFGTTSKVNWPIMKNYGAPATLDWFAGTWDTTKVGGTHRFDHNGETWEQQEMVKVGAGVLKIGPDHTYDWSTASGEFKGEWREATPAELAQSDKGGAGLVLLNAKPGESGKDWIVYKDAFDFKDTPDQDRTVVIADLNFRQTREYAGRR